MSQSVNITIVAKDQASQTFQAVGKSAGNMSSSLQQSAKGIGALKGAFGGLASSAAIGFLSDSARAAAEAEVSMARLQSAVEATGKSFDDLQPSLDAAISSAQDLAFDDEAAAEALATLTQYTGDTTEAMDLLALTMDIARGRGVELTTAATAVGKAASGSTGALARMGVVVEEGASAQEALAAAQEKFAGQAEAYSNTSAGAIDRMRTSFGNLQETIGGLAGPMTSIIALLPGLSTGFSALSTAIGGISGGIGASGVLSSIGGSAAGAVGPVAALGPAIAAVGVAAGAAALPVGVFLAAMYLTGDPKQAAAKSFDELTYGMERLGLTADSEGTKFLEFARNYVAGTVEMTDITGAFTGETANLTDLLPELVRLDQDLFDSVVGLIDPQRDLLDQYGELEPAISNVIAVQRARNAVEEQNAILVTKAAMAEFYRAEGIANSSKELEEATDKYRPFIAAQERANAIKEEEAKAYERSIPLIQIAAGHTDRMTTFVLAAARAEEEHNRKLQEQEQLALALQAAFTSALIPSVQGVAGAFQKLIVPGEDILDVLSRLGDTAPNINDSFADLADSVNDSADALDSVLGVFKAIDNMGGRSADAVEVAQNIVGDAETIGVVNDLLDRNLITLDQKKQAESDLRTILAANASVQDDLNVLRVAELDNLADAQVEYAAYIDKLSQASEAEQAHALYLMDTANQAKVAAAYSTALAGSLGDMPKEIATDLIVNAAAADPVLGSVLESYGLIERGVDGTITVNFPDASQQAVNKFEAMFGDGNVAMTANGTVVVTDAAGNQMVYDQFGNLVDKSVKATIEVTLSHPSGLDSDTIAGVLSGRGMSAEDAGVTETSFAVIIESDITKFEDGLEDAKTAVDEFTGEDYIADIQGNAEPWRSTVGMAREDAGEWDDAGYEADLNATADGDTGWNVVLAEAMRQGADWEAKPWTANIDGNRDFFDQVVSSIDKTTVGTAYMEIDAIDSNGDLAGTTSSGGGGGGGGRQLGGTIRSTDISSVARVYSTARNGRTVLVGEAGPELAFLPVGTQIMPSTPSRSRLAMDTQSQGIRFYGPVTITAQTPDIAAEIERQVLTRAMR